MVASRPQACSWREKPFKDLRGYLALDFEAASALLMVIGAARAFPTIHAFFLQRKAISDILRETWGKFGTWLLLGPEIELQRDIYVYVVGSPMQTCAERVYPMQRMVKTQHEAARLRYIN
jgi:hypothetical protein